MTQVQHQLEKVTILFAGDSGDGIQLTGTQFTTNTALFGNDLSTFPDFPAEIRAPLGTVAGVSGFQINFGAVDVYTPGDLCDVLVVMNVAALKKNLTRLKDRGTIIVNTAGFDKRNLRLAGVEEGQNPLLNNSLEGYKVHEFDITKLTRESLKDSSLGTKDRDRCKNMFVLGFVYWMYNRKIDSSISFLKTKFSSKAHNRHVTGITINNDGKLSLGRERKKYIKHLVHQFQLKKLDKDKLHHLKGLLAFAKHIEPQFVKSLIQKYSIELINQIVKESND